MASTHDGDPNKVYARLFSTGELSDVTVRCGSGMTRAHKVILYGKSEYFRKIIDNDSSDHVSSASYEINLGAYMGSELVYKALEFIYVGDYKPGASELLAQLKGFVEDPDSSKPKEHGDPKPVNHPWVNIHSEKELLMHLVLYQLAEKLQIPGFEDTIIKKFESACKMFWDSDSFVETVVQLFME
ncbi:hypothetical protein BU24DRAFT_451543 [Aaosphaeria arxii CBS 175.79]|uniref:BTB domain-containing protein n=1 Tax=Aaosphaeria arxii CBS 175.79 TaxID=1450172 RepID=A0A6A5XNP2_9PLEO|nr:uncharacterized protein BU24DRAFT_451543 [Aaosphaeria arxii CBS 175.79]KAF2014526.1 hypothetical protein BU24DRAFT_451543 [Aaosphaeria arxii CBS 175.79]